MYKIYFVLSKNLKKIGFWSQNFSTRKQSYYDILKLKQNCTSNEIRDAFLKLSKKHHPDVKGISKATQLDTTDYLKIMEAYQILSKRHSRNRYDESLGFRLRTRPIPHARTNVAQANHYWATNVYHKNTGQLKFSNTTLVFLLIAFALSGMAIEFYVIKNSVQLDQDRLDAISKKSSEAHAILRAQANKYGNEKQLELMNERIRKSE